PVESGGRQVHLPAEDADLGTTDGKGRHLPHREHLCAQLPFGHLPRPAGDPDLQRHPLVAATAASAPGGPPAGLPASATTETLPRTDLRYPAVGALRRESVRPTARACSPQR